MWVPRPNLIQQLNEGLHLGHRLTLASALAGSGKTSLLSDWLRQADRPVAWLSLDDGDNDATRFLAYLLAALQKIDPAIGQAAQATLQAPRSPLLQPLLIGVINDTSAISQPFVLVLDDYHFIDAAPVHDALSFLLDHLPQQMHLAIATRIDPPLPLARLRARGQLTELHTADLRFSLDEAAALLNQRMRLDLSAEQIHALKKRTEGWVTGLQLAALSLRGRDDVPAFVKAFTGSHHFVLDYLTEEVLDRQSEEIRAFLLQTSILDRLTAPLCDAMRFGSSEGTAVMERMDSQRILESLEAANLFIIPLDDERRWHRYHRLFADLLRRQLWRESGELAPELHRRASRWYEAKGLYPDAVSHALAAGDEERAAELIGWTGWAMLARGEMRALLGWLDSLSQDLVGSQLQLGVLRTWALALTGRWDDVEQSPTQVGDGPVPGEMAALQAYVASVQGDVPRTIALCRQASESLPEEKWFSRSFVALSLGIAYYASGQPAAASKALGEAIALSRTTGPSHMMLATMIELGHVQRMAGSLHQAAQTFDKALGLAPRRDVRPLPVAGLAYVGLAQVQYEWNDLDGALRNAREGVELTELGGFTSALLSGYARLVEVSLAHADLMGASQALEKAERLAQRHHYPHMAGVLAKLHVRFWVAQGNLAAASQWLREHRSSPGEEFDLAQEAEQLAVARVLLALNHPARALTSLSRLRELAEQAGRMRSLIEALALEARAFQLQGDSDQALSALERALSLAEPEGYVRTFVDEGQPMVMLLSQILVAQRKGREAVSQAFAPDYPARLLAAFPEPTKDGRRKTLTRSSSTVFGRSSVLVEPLSKREIEVLRLIAAGLSNQEIAQELVIAVSTVKSHVNHIYGKLDAKSRTQALAKAQALDLL
jgi:LuxR family maltose regulon positive regulatory protein